MHFGEQLMQCSYSPKMQEKYLTGKRNTYSTCVDPVKLFDCVPQIMLRSMRKTGVKERAIRIPKAMHGGD